MAVLTKFWPFYIWLVTSILDVYGSYFYIWLVYLCWKLNRSGFLFYLCINGDHFMNNKHLDFPPSVFMLHGVGIAS